MAISTERVEVEGTTYQITIFPATKGIKLLKQLMSIVGPSLAALAEDEAAEGEIHTNVISEAVQQLAANMDKTNVEHLIKELVGDVCYVDENDNRLEIRKTFDNHFAGEYGKLFKLLVEVVKLNYSNVFPEGFALNLENQ